MFGCGRVWLRTFETASAEKSDFTTPYSIAHKGSLSADRCGARVSVTLSSDGRLIPAVILPGLELQACEVTALRFRATSSVESDKGLSGRLCL
jgi:hypothetical protein